MNYCSRNIGSGGNSNFTLYVMLLNERDKELESSSVTKSPCFEAFPSSHFISVKKNPPTGQTAFEMTNEMLLKTR